MSTKSLKIGFMIEFIGSLLISTIPGLLYTGAYYTTYNHRGHNFVMGFSREHSILITLLVGILTLIGYSSSGAHFTPTLTFPLMAFGRIKIKEGIVFLIAQIGGYLLGGLVLMWLVPSEWDLKQRFRDPIPRPPAFEIPPYFFDDSNSLSNRNTAKLFGELFCGILLYFGYFLATRIKNLSSLGVSVVMGLTYFVVVAHSALISGGLVNSFRIFGYVYSRSNFGDNWSSEISVWPLAVSPIIAGLVGEILFSLVFKGKLPFNKTISDQGQGDNNQPTHKQEPIEEPLVKNGD